MESALLLDTTNGANLRFLFERIVCSVDNIRGIWWRRPLGAYRALPSTLQERYVESEAENYFRSIPNFLNNANWVSEPEATRAASRKPHQLMMAQKAGWRIPATFAGNSREGALQFLHQTKGRSLVVKAVGSGFVRLNSAASDTEGLNRVIYTKRVTASFIRKHIEQIASCPILLQEEIQKDLDVRVTVVGNKTFSVSIESGGRSSNEVDWRHHSRERIYQAHELPNSVAAQCVQIVESLGLAFGCIDLAYSRREGYTFFEINPQGQWLPSERIVESGISEALIELLTAV